MQQLTHTAAERNDERDTRPDRTRASKCSSACSQTQQPAPLAQRVRSPSSLIRSTTRVSRRRRRPPLVVVDVVVVVVPRRVRLTNLVPPSLYRFLLSLAARPSFPPFLPRSISVRYASLPVHPPTHETARSSRASTLTPRACTPDTLGLAPCYSGPAPPLLSSLSPRDASSFSVLEITRKKRKKKKKKGGRKKKRRNLFLAFFRLSFFLSPRSCRRSLVRSALRSRLSAIIFCPIVRSYVRACVPACERACVCLCTIASADRHTRIHTIVLVSLLCTRLASSSFVCLVVALRSFLRLVRPSFVRVRRCSVYIRESRRRDG